MTTLQLNNTIVQIDKGELVSFNQNNHEFIHQKGSPGWGSSDTEMFPIIGPLNENNFSITTPKGIAHQDQHGHLRQMQYKLVESDKLKAVYKKVYKANTLIKNSKYPEKSSLEFMQWPYSFEFEKSFLLSEKGLEIQFVISGEKNMPFMLGYHPAFKITTDFATIETENRKITINDIMAVGSRALQLYNCQSITLKDKRSITITTEGFGHFMCWTEVANMVCIEPICFYPYAVEQNKLHEGFKLLNDNAIFKVLLAAD